MTPDDHPEMNERPAGERFPAGRSKALKVDQNTQASSHDSAPPADIQAPVVRLDTKTGRLLSYLATGKRINRFQAECLVHDHVLNSSIAALQPRYGITVQRRRVTLPALGGKATVSCCEYWLAGNSLARARQLVGMGA